MKKLTKLALIEDWRKAHKWFSVQFNILNGSFLATWALLPEKFQNALPVSTVIIIAVVLLVLGTVGRVIDQTPKE